jgi:hypothetical protein
VHDSGHYVAGESASARRLLWAELFGVGFVVLALVPVPIVGANPWVVPLSAVSAMSGVALFSGSWLFDVIARCHRLGECASRCSTQPAP